MMYYKTTLCSLSYNQNLEIIFGSFIDSDSVYHDRAREFNNPNFGFSESCTKKNALTKLARMSRVRHSAQSIENRYNSLKILTKLFETFCHSTKGRHFEIDKLGFIRQSLILYFVAIKRRKIRAETNLVPRVCLFAGYVVA
jgi:dGTP triphosphohydrolase